ncbi:DNA mismatch repair protein MutT [Halarcobacter ebronensis]|uniref:DNA mismatch repair protein MutT n=1 Tax=Halarcobacter ebronensis TaxID=1462615 RepID=A0A4V1LQP5_9BACT|nr:DNA mismatch repair protein MutT [Halarcobacter ebronensis]
MVLVENIGCFKTVLDPYNGITIDSKDLPDDKNIFEENLELLIEKTKNKRNLIWIYMDISQSQLIPSATKKGFFFHTCSENFLLLVKKLKADAIVPTAANHTLGVGVVTINDKNEILVIKEKISVVGYKIPGGHIDDGEMISTAAKREVFEETGVEVEFESIISLGHFYPHQFHKSNLYVLCLAKPLSSKIDINDTQEIEDAKWVDVQEYLNDESVFPYSKEIVKTALEFKGLKRSNQEILTHLKKDFELFFPIKS